MKIFKSLSQTSKYMILGICVFFLLLLVLGLVVILVWGPWDSPLGLSPLPYSIGLLAGCISSVFKVISMENSLSRSMDMDGEKAKPYGQLQFFLRYLMTGALVVLIIFFPKIFGMLGAILGILGLPFGAYTAHFLLKIKGFEKEEN